MACDGANMKADNAERFERLLAALERELIEATDEEVLAAARELGMNPAMKGSAAFFGIATVFSRPFQPSDPWEPSGAPTPRRLKDDPPH
jgi:hypothetical protein